MTNEQLSMLIAQESKALRRIADALEEAIDETHGEDRRSPITGTYRVVPVLDDLYRFINDLDEQVDVLKGVKS